MTSSIISSKSKFLVVLRVVTVDLYLSFNDLYYISDTISLYISHSIISNSATKNNILTTICLLPFYMYIISVYSRQRAYNLLERIFVNKLCEKYIVKYEM